jgi:hypothetical protein
VNITANLDANTGNHEYNVGCVAWTLPGDSYYGDPASFRSTSYHASFDSLKLTYLDGSNAAEIPLGTFHGAKNDNPASKVQLMYDGPVSIPAGVEELQARVVMTFTNQATGEVETKVFDFKMTKREGKEIVPLTA